MKVIYDSKTDTLTIIFNDRPVAERDEDKPGTMLDYDPKAILFRSKYRMHRGG